MHVACEGRDRHSDSTAGGSVVVVGWILENYHDPSFGSGDPIVNGPVSCASV
jgi:hypothetical protein